MSTAAPTDRPKPKRRWTRLLALVLGFAILVVIGVSAYLYWTWRQEWIAAELEASESDARWRLAEIEADRDVIPVAENSALHIIEINKDSPEIRITNAWCYDLIFENLTPPAELNEDQLQLIRDELAKVGDDNLTRARRLKDMPRGRFPVAYADDFLGTLIGEQQNARAQIDWLKHDAWLLAHHGKSNEAIQSCRAILNVGRAFHDEPMVLSHVIHLAAQNWTAEALERVLAQGSAADEELRLMQAAFEAEMKGGHYLQAMRGERAGMHMLFENIRAGKVHFTQATSPQDADFKTDWLVDARVLWQHPDYLRHLNLAVEIARLPIHERHAPMQVWEARAHDRSNTPIWLFARGLFKVYEADCRIQGTIRSATAAVACERYRMRFGDWPATLTDLVEKKLLDAVPCDPMDNQPIRYRRTEEGIAVYSIGLDMTDDGGDFNHINQTNPRTNMGMRLWNVAQRRQPAPPRVEIPERKGNP